MEHEIIWAIAGLISLLVGRIVWDWLSVKRTNGNGKIKCVMADRCADHIDLYSKNVRTYDDMATTLFQHDVEAKVRSSNHVQVLTQILDQLKENGNKLDSMK